MKVKRFLANTTKAALAQVKERLGANAVILSNRTVPDGVEVLAIAESDMASVAAPTDEALAAAAPPEDFTVAVKRRMTEAGESAMRARAAPRAAAPAAAPAPATVAEPEPAGEPLPTDRAHFVSPNATVRSASFAQLLRGAPGTVVTAGRQAAAEPTARRTDAPAARGEARETTVVGAEARGAGRGVSPVLSSSARPAAEPEELLAEIRSLRDLMEERFTTLAWSEEIRRRPVNAGIMRQLLAAGFSTALVRAATNALPESLDARQAFGWLHEKLVGKLHVATGQNEIIERGGVFALTGPTGVGKTTTAAKLAARAVMKHGAASLGLVTTDTYRIGAHDQLRVFGKILGVPVHAVHDALGLEQTLAQLGDKRLVIVDTIGLGQRDERVAEQQTMLDACGVQRLVLFSATSQLEALEDVINAYLRAPQSQSRAVGAIVTKTDEAVKLGPVVDVLIRHKLMLQFLGTGQRVPEDLVLPDVNALVQEAMQAPLNAAFAPSSEEAKLIAMGGSLDGMFASVAHA
jgi:flagellar biosynthesis protein FlhF